MLETDSLRIAYELKPLRINGLKEGLSVELQPAWQCCRR